MAMRSESGRERQWFIRVECASGCMVLHVVQGLAAIDESGLVVDGFGVDVRRDGIKMW